MVRAVFAEQHMHNGTTPLSYSRLRFAPMPAAETLIQADLVLSATRLVAADLTTGVPLAVPENKHEEILMPIAISLYSKAPWFRIPADLRQSIADDYNGAVAALKSVTSMQEQGGTFHVVGY